MVTTPLAPVPVIVIITPPDVESAASCTDVGSDDDQLAEFPSLVTAGIWNVCAVLPGMNAEYIGEKLMGMDEVAHEPGLVLLTDVVPPSSFEGLVTGVLLSPPPFPPPPGAVFELPEQAAMSAPTPMTPVERAVTSALRLDREFIITPSEVRGRKTRGGT